MATEQEILARMDSCRDMAVSLARPYAKRERARVDYSDALCNAIYHLWRAARGFDESRGYEFTTYAYHAISNGLMRDYRMSRGLCREYPRRKRRQSIDAKLRRAAYIDSDDMVVDRSPQPDVELAEIEQYEFDVVRVQDAVQFIGEQNKEIFFRRVAGEGMKEIGASLGLSKQRIQQIEKNAIKEIRVRCGLRECGREAG
jgi:RNA polymerase sigma factor (sigma-70 family)